MKKLLARSLLALTFSAMLASCQTTPTGGFAARQVEVLREAGFAEVDGNYELGLEDRLLFDIDRSEVKPAMVTRLTGMAHAMAEVQIYGAMLEGHTDSTGSSDHNRQLSLDRASAVQRILADNGLQQGRLSVVAMGESDPIASNETSEGRAQNRRVVVIVRPGDVRPL